MIESNKLRSLCRTVRSSVAIPEVAGGVTVSVTVRELESLLDLAQAVEKWRLSRVNASLNMGDTVRRADAELLSAFDKARSQ